MVQLRAWSSIGVPASLLVLVALTASGISTLGWRAPPVHSQEADAGTVVQALFDAQDQGDVEGTMGDYSDDALFFGVPPCIPMACSRTAIQQRTASYIANHGQDSITSMHVDGSIVSGRIEASTDSIRASGVQRVAVGFVAAVVNGKVRTLAIATDTSDPQTAQYAAARAAQSQPTPGASTP